MSTNERTAHWEIHRQRMVSAGTVEELQQLEHGTRQQCLEGISERDIERLRAQLAPFAKRYLGADDRPAFTRCLREWSMRGHSCRSFDAVFEMLKDEHRAEREANHAPRRRQLRQLYPEMYAPVNPGLRIVGRPPPNFTERIRAWVRGGTPDRPAPTVGDRVRAALQLKS